MAKTSRLHLERSPIAALPVELDSAEDKVAYLLWREGEHCFCDLQIRTGLPREILIGALRSLLDARRIRKLTFPPGPDTQDDEVHGLTRFSLAAARP